MNTRTSHFEPEKQRFIRYDLLRDVLRLVQSVKLASRNEGSVSPFLQFTANLKVIHTFDFRKVGFVRVIYDVRSERGENFLLELCDCLFVWRRVEDYCELVGLDEDWECLVAGFWRLRTVFRRSQVQKYPICSPS